MDPKPLLISDPPHHEVDPIAVAPLFGLTAAEVRMKANYGVPEVWFAQDDGADLQEIATALTEAGLKTVVVDGSELGDIPPQRPADSVAFEDAGLRVVRDGSESMVAYDAPAVGVFARPQPTEGQTQRSLTSLSSQLRSGGRLRRRTRNLGADGTEPEFSTFFDVYVPSDEGLLRVTIAEGVTDVSGLPQDVTGPTGMWSALKECEARFENMHIDRRLVDMRLRVAQLVLPKDSSRRAGFSYATTALNELLGSLSSALGDASQADLSSQLAYLTSRSRTG